MIIADNDCFGIDHYYSGNDLQQCTQYRCVSGDFSNIIGNAKVLRTDPYQLATDSDFPKLRTIFHRQAEIQQFKVYELSGKVSFFFEETKEEFRNEFQNLDKITVNDISVRITAMVHDVPIFVEDIDLECLLKNYDEEATVEKPEEEIAEIGRQEKWFWYALKNLQRLDDVGGHPSNYGKILQINTTLVISLPWRNRLARSAVNRKVGGSSPPGSDV
ncbi:hypothetical protein GJ496_008069 [Pomphorhynchus laevis]|nr:hypothetical protein GJ496_008069 [Pomphorhynchus laevis]